MKMWTTRGTLYRLSGEVAILVASEGDILENIVSASGKFGGVAGVFAGVINCKDTN